MKSIQAFLDKIRRKAGERGYTCDGCNEEVFSYPSQRLCKECEAKLIYNARHTCDKCGRATKTAGVCLDCKSLLPHFTKGASAFVYQGYVCSLVNRLKNGDRYLSHFFGERLAERYLQVFQDAYLEKPLLIGVPLSQEKREERGYNQAEEILKAFALSLQTQGVQTEYVEDVLQKPKQTPPQKTLTRVERIKNLQGAFHVHKRTVCVGRIIVLIDDITTTGATGSECAKALLSAGAKEVRFLTCAALSERG